MKFHIINAIVYKIYNVLFPNHFNRLLFNFETFRLTKYHDKHYDSPSQSTLQPINFSIPNLTRRIVIKRPVSNYERKPISASYLYSSLRMRYLNWHHLRISQRLIVRGRFNLLDPRKSFPASVLAKEESGTEERSKINEPSVIFRTCRAFT